MATVHFELESDYIELNQLLKLVGLCGSGGIGKQIVASGVVFVDGQVELRKTAKIRSGQKVSVEDVVILID
jgi:ribosome-associated protein